MIVLVALVPIWCAASALLDGWKPLGDNALIALRTRDLLNGRLPLIGLPTSGENYSGAPPSSHPGPLSFYIFALPVLLVGSGGVAIGAAVINSAALVISVWNGFRRGGLVLASLIGIGLLAMAWSLGPSHLYDPLSSSLWAFPLAALVLLSWGVMLGDNRLLPIWVVVASFVVGVHAAALAVAGPLVALVGVVVVVRVIRSLRRRSPSEQSWVRTLVVEDRVVLVAMAIGLVLWLPPLVDQVAGTGNLGALFATFGSERAPGRGLGFGFDRLWLALGPPPLLVERWGPLDHLQSVDAMQRGLGMATACVWGFLVVRAPRHQRFLSPLAVVAGALGLSGVWAAAGLSNEASLKANLVLWMWVVSAVVWVGLAWTAWQGWGLRPRQRRDRSAAMVALAGCVVVAALLVVGPDGRPARDEKAMPGTEELINEVTAAIEPGRYALTFDGGVAATTVGPTLALALDEKPGVTFLVRRGPAARAYGDRQLGDQKVDGLLVVRSGSVERSGDREVMGRAAVYDGGGRLHWTWVELRPA